MAQRLLALPYETWPIGSSEGTRVFTEVQRKCSKFKPSEMYAVSTGKQFPTFRRKTVLLFSRCSGRPLGPDEKPNTSLRNIVARTSKLADSILAQQSKVVVTKNFVYYTHSQTQL
jgi:hypothetical protein